MGRRVCGVVAAAWWVALLAVVSHVTPAACGGSGAAVLGAAGPAGGAGRELGGGAGQAGEDESAAAAAPPNILFILTDDVGLGDINVGAFHGKKPAAGSPRVATPHLAALARESVVFKHTYTAPICGPSRFSLLTGLGTGRSPVRGNPGRAGADFSLSGSVDTFPRRLRELGYKTMLVGKYGFSSDPRRAGFTKFYGTRRHSESHSCFPAYLYENNRKVKMSFNAKALAQQHSALGRCKVDELDAESECDYYHDLITARALQWIEGSAAQDQPWMMQVSYIASHSCAWSSNMRDPYPLVMAAPFADAARCPLGAAVGQPLRDNECRFRSMLTNYLDRDVGRLLGLIDSLGIADNTVVAFSSDNGPSDQVDKTRVPHIEVHKVSTFDSLAGYRGGKRTMLEGGVRVPLMVRWPRFVKSQRVVHRRVMLHDMHATFVQLARGGDFADPAQAEVIHDSVSLVPSLVDGAASQPPRPHIYIEHCDAQVANWRTLRTAPEDVCSYTFIDSDGRKLVYDHETAAYALFDLAADHLETKDLFPGLTDQQQQQWMLKRAASGAFRSIKDSGFKGRTSIKLSGPKKKKRRKGRG